MNESVVCWKVNGRDVKARLCVEDRRLSLEIDQYYVLCIDEDGTFWRDMCIGESSGLKLDDFGRIIEQDPRD